MSKSTWKQRQREAKQQLPPVAMQKFSYTSMLKYSFQIFVQKYFIILIPFLIFTVIMATVKLFIVPDIIWNYYALNDAWMRINYKVFLDPTYVATSLDSQVYYMITQYYWFAQILIGFLDAIPQYFGILTTAVIIKRTYELKSQSKKSLPAGALLAESFTNPFRGGNAVSAIIPTILLSFLVPLGLLFLYIPGFLILVYLMFSLQTTALEKGSPKSVLVGGFNHVRKKVRKTIVIVLFVFLLSFLWNALRDVVLPLVLAPPNIAAYNPANRDLGAIYLDFLTNSLWITFIYPLVASLYTMLYLHIKAEKADTLTKPDMLENSEIAFEDRNIRIRRTQQMRICPHCGRSIPVSLKVCNHCHREIRSKLDL
ncbi:MAG: hypothetical protein RBG13Loki_2087 [Promethearchaeota archaeon CR_4]|nr:MAG: hypothetical protein RBG13Loki_2087 [Candidatus Lokiarchaeota archaeon CR_4]